MLLSSSTTRWGFKLLTAFAILALSVALVFVAIYGQRICTIVNPPLTHTLFWVGDRQSELRNRLNNQADVNAKNGSGATPLHLAAQFGKPTSVNMLIDAGANVLARDNRGQGVLHYAVNGGSADSIRTLLKHGAELNLQDRFSISPLHRAVSLGASAPTNGANVTLLLNAGADIDATTNEGDTPLHWAVTSYYVNQTLIPLLRAGSDLERTNNKGETPLHIAARTASEEAALLLMSHGANSLIRDHSGSTPFELTQKYNSRFSQTTMAALRGK